MSVSHNTIQSYNISMSMVKTRVKVLYFDAQSSTNQNYSSYKLVFKKIRYRIDSKMKFQGFQIFI